MLQNVLQRVTTCYTALSGAFVIIIAAPRGPGATETDDGRLSSTGPGEGRPLVGAVGLSS